MKLIRSFLSLLLFAVCTAFSFPANANPKPVIVPLKAEAVKPAPMRKAVKTNFVRTDALVMYETAAVISDSVSSYRAGFSVSEGVIVKRAGISKFFRVKPEFYRRIELNFV